MKQFFERWKSDYEFRTIVSAGFALVVTFAFALYNGYLGIRYSSMWYGTICVYYLLLLIIRNTIIFSRRKYSTWDNWETIRKKIFRQSRSLSENTQLYRCAGIGPYIAEYPDHGFCR